ncbi:MAG: hypothetical protein ABIR96_03810 [Bdellovibrionota bacterium]
MLGFELLFRLLWGFALSVVFVRRTESSEKFVRIAARFVWGLGLASALLGYFAVGTTGAALAGLTLCTFGFELYARVYATWGRLLGFTFLIAGPFVAYASLGAPSMINFLGSGLLLGGFFGGQFLGHWFLNVPGMAIRELTRLTGFLFIGLSAKTVETLWALFERARMAAPALIDPMGRPLGEDVTNTDFLLKLNPSNSVLSLEGDLWLKLGSYGLILLSMRLIWGIIAPWILALMVRDTVGKRATQSATGILYAACVMVLVGEAVALYIRDSLHIFM